MTRKKIAKCVLIADIHFNLNTLELASTALDAAIFVANEMEIPLILAGDTLDQKAIIRGEVANRLIKLLDGRCRPIILGGNHDQLCEKTRESSLEFLRPYADVVTAPLEDTALNLYYIPYCHDPKELVNELRVVPKGMQVIGHFGVKGASMGHYASDKSAVDHFELEGLHVYLGHYHTRQTIKCGNYGEANYIGNPYSLTFGEAADGPKGFQVLYDDNSLEFVPTNMRKHIVCARSIDDLVTPVPDYRPGDLVWLKVTGPESELAKLDKNAVGQQLLGTTNYKLDKIAVKSKEVKVEKLDLTNEEIFDSIIDETYESLEYRSKLKKLWRSIA